MITFSAIRHVTALSIASLVITIWTVFGSKSLPIFFVLASCAGLIHSLCVVLAIKPSTRLFEGSAFVFLSSVLSAAVPVFGLSLIEKVGIITAGTDGDSALLVAVSCSGSIGAAIYVLVIRQCVLPVLPLRAALSSGVLGALCVFPLLDDAPFREGSLSWLYELLLWWWLVSAALVAHTANYAFKRTAGKGFGVF